MFRITRIDKLVLKAFLPPFLMSFLIILFILVMQFMAVYMDKILGKGLGIGILFKMIGFAGGKLAISAMPVAVLAGALISFGSFGEHYELAAIKSSGISLLKAMRSSIILGVILVVGSIALSHNIVPLSNLKFYSLYYDISRKKAELALTPGIFYWDITNYVIRVADKNNDRGTLYDVLIYDHTENRGNNDVIIADSAKTYTEEDRLQMVLYAGVRHEEMKPESGRKNYPHGRTYFDSLYYTFNLEDFKLSRTEESQFRHQITLSQDELGSAIDSLGDLQTDYLEKAFNQIGRYTKVDSNFLTGPKDTLKYDEPLVVYDLAPGDSIIGCDNILDHSDALSRSLVNIRAVKSYLDFMNKKKSDQNRTQRKFLYEYYLRYAVPINCLVFMIIGVSLGAIIRKGGLGMPAIVSIIFFIISHIAGTYGRKFSKEGVLSPEVGAFLPVIIFTPIALIVVYQATMDTRIMEAESWKKVNKVFRFLRIIRNFLPV
ncbi:MAG: LptF/LptG family permease [Bacteroidota bacterium]